MIFSVSAVKKWFAGLLLCISLGQAQVPKALQQIPIEDRLVLSDFFKGLLTQGSFAATLFGQKPACTFDYPPEFVPFWEDRFKTRYLLESRGWKTWNKYRHLFDCKNYLFLYAEREFLSVFFVHRGKMQSVLTKHREFFQRHFSEQLLNEPLNRFLSHAFAPCFHHYNFHLAQGLLLGYDWKNCLEFQKRDQISDTLAYFPYDVLEPEIAAVKLDGLLDGYPEDLMDQRTYYEEHFSLKKQWPDTNPFFPTISSGYMAFEMPYDPQMEQIHGAIVRLYNSNRFLEDFLEILMGDEENCF